MQAVRSRIARCAVVDGERAPRAKEVRFGMLPGSYDVRLTLTGSDGERGYFVRTLQLW